MSTTQLRILAVLTAFLIGPASPTSTPGALTARTSRLNVRPGTELVLECGDRTHTGVVKYWQTPFGQLRHHGHSGDADFAVSMRADGSLFAANAGELHSGMYYCLLVAEGGTTLWPYQVHVVADLQTARGNSAEGAGFTRDPVQLRHRRDLGSSGQTEEQGRAGAAGGVFAGAVAGSVLLTFVLGFTAGALSRAHVLRCLRVVSSKIRPLWRRRSNGRGCEVVMTTLPDTYHSEVIDDVIDDDMGWPRGDTTLDTTCSSCTSSPPPPKPQRSFRREGQEEKEVEQRKGGEAEEDYVEERVEVRLEEERRDRREEEQIREDEEEVEKRRERRDKEKENEKEERKGGGHGEEDAEGEQGEQEMEESGVTGEESRVGGDQSPTVTMTECSSQAGGGPGRRSTGVAEEKEEGLVEEQMEATSAREEFQNEGGETDDSSDGDSDSSSDTQDGREQEKPEEEGREQAGKEGAEEEAPAGAGVRRGRRSRVIRLYQYDEEGHRYSHLPSPAPGESDPAPRLKQRTQSLTRLSAIMAAATAGPLSSPSGGAAGEERCPSPPFSPAAVFKMDF